MPEQNDVLTGEWTRPETRRRFMLRKMLRDFESNPTLGTALRECPQASGWNWLRRAFRLSYPVQRVVLTGYLTPDRIGMF